MSDYLALVTAHDDASDCQICLVGQWNEKKGAAHCMFCVAGTQLSNNGTNASKHDEPHDCVICGAGLYSDIGSGQCQSCPKGTYLDDAGVNATKHASVDACKDCAKGTWSTSAGASSCAFTCPIGKYGTGLGSTSEGTACDICPNNQYQNHSGEDECRACPNARYTRTREPRRREDYTSADACYAPPNLFRVTPTNSTTHGGIEVSFYGENFLENATIEIHVGGRKWYPVTWKNNTWITARASPGTGRNNLIKIKVDGILSAPNDVGFSYTAPNITSIIAPGFKGGTLQVFGTDFGDQEQVVFVHVGESACSRECIEAEIFPAANGTQRIQCQYNVGGAPNTCRDVYIIVNGQSSNLVKFCYQFDKGEITGVPVRQQSVYETANYSYAIGLQLAAKVTVQLRATPNSSRFRCAVIPSTLVFNSTKTQAVTVTTTGNMIDEGTDETVYFCTIVHTVESEDPKYATSPQREFQLNVLNNDVADMNLMTINPAGDYDYDVKFIGPLSSPENNTVAYGIRIETQPQQPVIITFNISLDKSDNTISQPRLVPHPTELVFNSSNWRKEQRVQLHSQEDFIDHHTQRFKIIHDVTTADKVFRDKVLQRPLLVIVDVPDNDDAGIVITPSTSITLTEDGPQVPITIVKLGSKPLADVDIHIEVSSDKLEATPTSPVRVAIKDWNTVNTVIQFNALVGVSGTPGDLRIALRPESTDPQYNASSTIVRLDVGTILLERTLDVPASAFVDEGSVYEYKARLTTRPDGDVSIIITTSPECTVEGQTTVILTSAAATVSGVTIGIKAVDNFIDEGGVGKVSSTCQVNHTLHATDAKYHRRSTIMILEIRNNDIADIKLQAYSTVGGSFDDKLKILGPLCLIEGGNVSYRVVLSSRPTAPVYVTATIFLSRPTSPMLVHVLPPTFTISPSAWNVSQNMVVTSSRDFVDNDMTVDSLSIRHSVRTNDTIFQAAATNAIAKIEVTDFVEDDAGIVITPSTSITLTEDGPQVPITIVKLGSKPLADVDIYIDIVSTAKVSAYYGMSNIEYRMSNKGWQKNDPVRINRNSWDSVDKVFSFKANFGDAEDGANAVSLRLKSDDPKYDSEDTPSITVDLETRIVFRTGTMIFPQTQDVSEGSTAAYDLTLSPPPSENVIVRVSTDTSSGCSVVGGGAFYFSALVASQTVKVVTENDDVDSGNAIAFSCVVNHTVADTTDSTYAGLHGQMHLIVGNIDEADLKLQALNHNEKLKVLGPLCLEEGRNVTYRVILNSRPTAPVHVMTAIILSRATSPILIRVAPSTFTISPDAWNIPHEIVVTSTRDFIDNDAAIDSLSIHHSFRTNDSVFLGKAKNATTYLQVTDHVNDVAQLETSPAAGELLVEEGVIKEVQIKRLASKPRKHVNITARLVPHVAGMTLTPALIDVPLSEWEGINGIFSLTVRTHSKNIQLDIQCHSGDPMYNFLVSFPLKIQKRQKAPKKPTLSRVDGTLTRLNVTWAGVTTDDGFKIQWTEDKLGTFSREVDIWHRQTVTLKVSALSQTVVRVRVRVGGNVNNPWSTITNEWVTAADCDEDTQYLETMGEFDNWKCIECPEGAVCKGKNVTWKEVKPLFGWWRIAIWTENRASNFSLCGFAPACLGAKNLAFKGKFLSEDGQMDPALQEYPEECNSNIGYASRCDRSDDHRCRLCATCAQGYRRREIGGSMQCDKCPPSAANKVLLTVGALVVMGVLGFMVLQHMNKGGKRTLSSMQKIIVINYFQLTYMIANMDIPWPAPLRILFDIEGAVSTIGEHLLNPACELTHVPAAEVTYQKQIAYMFLLPVLILCTKTFWRVSACLQGRPFRYRGENNRSPSHRDGSIATIVFLMYLVYPTLCRQAFVLLICKKVGAEYYLASDLQEVCWAGRHLVYIICCTIPQIAFHVFGIPLLGLRAAKYNRKDKIKRRFSISLFRYGLLYSAYSEKRWYWGAVSGSRKAIIAFLTSFLSDANLEVHWTIFFLAVSIMANMFGEPYVGAKGIRNSEALMLQRFDSTSLFVLLTTAWSGLFFNLFTSCGTNEIFCLVILGFAMLVNVSFFVYCCYLFRAYVRTTLLTIVSRLCCFFRVQKNKRHQRNRGSVHMNPLQYRRSLVVKEYINPMVDIDSRSSNSASDFIQRPEKSIEMRNMRVKAQVNRIKKARSASQLKSPVHLKMKRNKKRDKLFQGRKQAPKKRGKMEPDEETSAWFAVVDNESGQLYYVNEFTNESVWELPENAQLRPDYIKN